MQRIRTTHVGSLIRPPDLVTLAQQASAGDAAAQAAHERRLAEAVSEVVRRQRAIGLDIVNDGEYGKSSWHLYVTERLSGFERLPSEPTRVSGKDVRDFADFYAQENAGLPPARPFTWTITGPVRYVGAGAIRRDIAALRAAAGSDAGELFMAAVAPASVAAGYRNAYYRDDEEALFAIAAAMREEYRAIVDAGLILQVDDAYLAIKYDLMLAPADIEPYRRWAAVRIDALNAALEGLPPERVRYHLCWGSWNAPHASDVELPAIVDLLLRANVGGYALEMANPRHAHEWQVWERTPLPEGRVLVPGVVSHATNVVEHPELVAERLVRLARLVGPANVIAGTDCGFAQVAGMQRVHPSIMWAKLQALVDGARLASRALETV